VNALDVFQHWSHSEISASLGDITKIEDPEEATLEATVNKAVQILKVQQRQLGLLNQFLHFQQKRMLNKLLIT
jgi:hypothetical protein